MLIFKTQGEKLERVREVQFKEKELQKVTESNLDAILGLRFVNHEVRIGNLRFDTLAFDPQAKSFIIIEYKKDRNVSVVDQGYAYLAAVLNNKADCILEYNEHSNSNLKRGDVDWTQTKVIFVSPEFTKYQKQAIGFRDLPIELWEVKKFDNGTISFNQLESPEMAESITKVSGKSELVQKVSKEVKVYSEDDHLKGRPDEIKKLYNEVRERILNVGTNVQVKPKKYYIGFITDTNFVDVVLQKGKLLLYPNMKSGTLQDAKKLARDVSQKGHWGNGDYEVPLPPNGDLEYALSLVEQSYKSHQRV